ncbi:hypothetical protein AB3S75_041696 [Citrus x aurantiifolia]
MKRHQHQYVCHAGEMIPSPLLSCFRQGLGCRNHFSRVRNLLLCLCRVIKIKNLPSYSEAYMRFNASAVNRWSNLRFASFSRCIFLVSFNLLLLFHLNNLMAFWFRFWFPCRHQPLRMEPGEVSGQLRGLER